MSDLPEPIRVEKPAGYWVGNAFYADAMTARIARWWRHTDKPAFPDFLVHDPAATPTPAPAETPAAWHFDDLPSDAEPPDRDPDGIVWR